MRTTRELDGFAQRIYYVNTYLATIVEVAQKHQPIFVNISMRESEVMRFSFAERLHNGMLTEEQARREQQRLTGEVIQMEGVERGGWIARLSDGSVGFDNLAKASEWAKHTGGLLYGTLDGKRVRLAGQTVDEIISGSKVT
jgi:hypothetical protein